MSHPPWISPTHPTHTLHALPLPLLTALTSSSPSLATAQSLSPFILSNYLLSEECVRVWKRRKEQVLKDEKEMEWVTRLIVYKPEGEGEGVVVGRAGFHGAVDGRGVVEVGYSIDPKYRRQGHATVALGILMHVAREDKRVGVVRASVGPDNLVSRRLIERCGFVVVGEQWDEEDGLEIVSEVDVKGDSGK